MNIQTINVLAGFQRRLVLRLLLVGLVASVMAAIAAFYIETERLEDTLVNQATLEAKFVSAMLADSSGRPANEKVLTTFLQNHTSNNLDFFVHVEMYNESKQTIAEASLPGFSFIEVYSDRFVHRFPQSGRTWYDKLSIEGSSYLQVIVPLPGGNGKVGGWFEGIYRWSPKTLAAIDTDILQIIMLVVGAVLLTASVLYPLMSSLQGHIVAAAKGLLRANIDSLKVLGSAIAKRDSDTNAHNFRVTVLAIRIAEAMNVDDAAIRCLIKGSFLHDVGKIAVPDAILLKPGKLSEDELTTMKTHVTHGLDIIAASVWLRDAANIVGGHHEKIDGSGYPCGLVGEDIPLSARIFAVADVFDALTSERPYKRAMSVEQAMVIMEQGRGLHFDSPVLDAFCTLMPQLHAEIAKCGDSGVEAMTDNLLARYFRM
ncbi:MAG: HD-GYP domain-containing protein [Rhodospirillaceae bacterium]